jgi:hypothetical protein
MTLENSIQSADKFYSSFINQFNDREFFLCLIDYVRFISENENTNKISKNLLGQAQKEKAIIVELEKKSTTEINEQADKLIKIIKTEKLDFPGLGDEVLDYQACRNSLSYSFQAPVTALYECLSNIIENLLKNKYIKNIENFATFETVPKKTNEKGAVVGFNYYLNKLTFSKYFPEYQETKKLFNDKAATEVWGAWDFLFNNLTTKNNTALNISTLLHRKQLFSGAATRFHNYLITKLNGQKKKVSFNLDYLDNIKGLFICNDFQLEFKKVPARIINYFLNEKDLSKENYYSYIDFNKEAVTGDKNITSDYFSKRINLINKRINKETNGFINELLEKERKQPTLKQTVNKYRLNINL